MLKEIFTLGSVDHTLGRLKFLGYQAGLFMLVLLLAQALYLMVEARVDFSNVAQPPTITQNLATGDTSVSYSLELETPLEKILGGLLLISFFAFLWGTICLWVKRLRDLGNSQFLLFLILVPYLNILLFLYLVFRPGRLSETPQDI